MQSEHAQGLLLIDKPKGWTSFDVVNYVRRIVAGIEGKKPKNCKVGHTGTLDPLATGLLVLLVGKEYTRRAGGLSKLDKTYDVVMKLGETSTTADGEGEKSAVSSEVPPLAAIETALQKFTGELMQTPPIYSAMKVGGQRAYKLAREGKEVTMEPRPALIYSTTLASYEYPFVRFESRVGSGTYIRSLVEDLGRELATGAYMSDLRRTAVGKYDLADAVEVEKLTPELLYEKLQELAAPAG
ncbi:MAG TPA: tRNA pseudouridine(55) synthase TruB [Candidatus Saccharimonadales bacterium]|jgi:tRNA pseudouridine55 synthase